MVKLTNGRHFDPTKYDDRYRYNTYTCRRQHVTLTCDIDKGVTPMFMACPQPGCGATAESMMYPDPPPPSHLFPVKAVWRRATKDEMRRARRDNDDHYEKGGLHREWIR